MVRLPGRRGRGSPCFTVELTVCKSGIGRRASQEKTLPGAVDNPLDIIPQNLRVSRPGSFCVSLRIGLPRTSPTRSPSNHVGTPSDLPRRRWG